MELKDQYYNMREKIEPVMHIIDVAFKAMEEAGVTPKGEGYPRRNGWRTNFHSKDCLVPIFLPVA